MGTNLAELSDEQKRRFADHAQVLAREGDAGALERMAAAVGLDDEVRHVLRDRPVATGTLDAFVVVRTRPRAALQEILPRGLQLAPQPLTLPDRHPVLIMFAREQLDSKLGDTDFHSFTLAVPWVQHADPHVPHRGPFIYRARQYVDDRIPELVGERVYGLERERVKIEADDNAYRLYPRHDRSMMVEGWFQRRGDPVAPTSLPRFDDLRPLFDQPVITQALRIVDEYAARELGGPFLGFINRYLFDDPRARLTSARALVQLKRSLLPPAFGEAKEVVAGIDERDLGAFHLHVPQEVSLPTQSVKLRFPEAPITERKKRVVVLGGGPSSCAAAFYLAKTGRYDITMYTLGFRLGGKCAAGRNADKAYRIEEHGLHAFVGFYNNAFRTVREVYEAAEIPLQRGTGPWTPQRLREGEGPFAEAFIGNNIVGLMGRWPGTDGEQWRYYSTSTEIRDSIPGEVPFDKRGPTGFGRAIRVTLIEAIRRARELRRRDRGEDPSTPEIEEVRWWKRLFGRVAVPFADDEPEDDDDDFDIVEALDRCLDKIEDIAFDELVDGIERGAVFLKPVRKVFERVREKARRDYADKIRDSSDQWFEWCGLEFSLTIAIGILRDKVIHLAEIDRWDLVEWLLRHDIHPACARSPVVMFLYDSSFATGDTEPVKADHLAAGVGIRWFLLLLDYHGFQVYEFRYSCPQVLITPYYRALTKLGVEIRFFHKVEALQVEMRDGERHLAGVRLQRQATVKGGPGNYDPLWLPPIEGNPPALTPWPNHPDYDQLEEGEALRRQKVNLEDAWSPWRGEEFDLRQGRDFDLCICGLSLGALPAVTADLTDPSKATYSRHWAEMLDQMTLCPTASMQLWMERPREELYGPGDGSTIPEELGLLTELEPPEPSFGDFTHLIQHEPWQNDPRIIKPPRFLGYHTGALVSGKPLEGHPFDDHGYPDRTQAQWRERATEWLRSNYRVLYNRAPANFDEFCDQLVAPEGTSGQERLSHQYFHVGLQPWDLYVLSHPGTTGVRLGQAESWCHGLFLCGDWTDTSINAGCVEAATQSGMLAARAISKHPRYVWHVGY